MANELQIIKLASRLNAIQKELMSKTEMPDEEYQKLAELIKELEGN
jgi:uncharacterized membrane protein